MEKTEIASLDLKFLVKELRQVLVGGMFRKIYQYRSREGETPVNQFLFDIFVPGKGNFLLYADNKKVFLTKHKKVVPQEPPNFCMFLRKHLMGKKITNVTQYDFDRILQIFTEENVLIFEFFGDGNVILCDTSNNIIMPMEIQRWKSREVKPKVPYIYPPQRISPIDIEFDHFRKLLKKYEKNVVGFLAADMGMSPVYAKEACARAEVDQDRNTNQLGLEETVRLHNVLSNLEKEKVKPVKYDDCVSPFPLVSMAGKEKAESGTFSQVLDDFFSEQSIRIEQEEEKEVFEEQKEKVEKIIEHQDEAKDKWERISSDSREIGDLIYNYYGTVQGAIEGIRKARDMGISWEEIKSRIRSEPTPEAECIKEVREGDGIVVLELGGREVEIDIRKSVEENAASYYEDSKWARGKLGGLETAMNDQQERLRELESSSESDETSHEEPKESEESETGFDEIGLDSFIQQDGDEPEPEDEKPFQAEEAKWYEKFKWFFSSDGFLVIAGRDADQNEEILKKYAESNDLVFHADIPGAAFTVIKTQGMDVPEETKREAAEFAAANSKAWTKGLGTMDIFAVPRTQVSKNPPSGTALPKGSFMIYGEREWFRNMELKLAIGVMIDQERNMVKVLSGPLMSTRKNSTYFVTIKPGFKKTLELARSIKNKILIKARPEDKFLIERIPMEELQKAIPSGMGEVVESVSEI